jgi:hypothetical protein
MELGLCQLSGALNVKFALDFWKKCVYLLCKPHRIDQHLP